jgi:RNase P subunit RPR2
MKISYLTSYKRTSVNFRSSPFWDVAQHLQNFTLEDGTNMMSQNYQPLPQNISEGRSQLHLDESLKSQICNLCQVVDLKYMILLHRLDISKASGYAVSTKTQLCSQNDT